jgi:predicted amidophosphoribosyltransferase
MTLRPALAGLAEAGRDLLDLVVPQECAGCGRPGRAWCPLCAASVEGPTVLVPAAVWCRAATRHEGPAARAVVAFKDRGARSLVAPLGDLLARAVLDVLADRAEPLGGPVWLVPVPTRREARRRRGSDHMAVLAGRAARSLRSRGVHAHRCSVLAHVGHSRDQVGLSRGQRRANVSGTLVARAVPAGHLVLVDDVTTTGATLAEAVRALQAQARHPAAAATVTFAVGTPHLASGGPRD